MRWVTLCVILLLTPVLCYAEMPSEGNVKAEGKSLKDGDLLSLGSFSALLPPKAGSTVTVRYTDKAGRIH